MKRLVIKIDEEKCDGCGLCVPECAEGAIQIIDGKARLISEKYCDGLGACLSECPQEAIVLEEREAEGFDEEAVKLHLQEMEACSRPSGSGERVSPFPAASGCPSAATMRWNRNAEAQSPSERSTFSGSMLSQWPVKLALVHPQAPYFEDADLIVVADCVPFAHDSFHQDFLKGKAIVIGCPKLDDIQLYQEKLAEILRRSSVRSVEVIHMEVPCCFGLHWAVEEAIGASGKSMPFEQTVIGVKGGRQPD